MSMKLSKPIVFFDLESTGLDTQNDRIVQFSATKFFPDGGGEKMNFKVNPEMDIPTASSEIHGITNEDIKDEVKFYEIAVSIMDFMADCDWSGFNIPSFDVPLLLAELARSTTDLEMETFIRTIGNIVDVRDLWNIIMPMTLSNAYKTFVGAEMDPEKAHDAIYDNMCTAEVFQAMFEKYKYQNIDHIAQLIDEKFRRADLSGKLTYNDNGDVCWNFGKNKDKKVSDDISYCDWFLRSDFPYQSKLVVKEVLGR